MIKKILFFAVVLLFVACNKSGRFSVSGTIADADGETLYFAKTGLLKDSLIDSVKLSATGKFRFKTQSPKYPELYRLQVKNLRLILGVDSIEDIQIEGSVKQLIDAKITNSTQSEQIQKLRKTVVALQTDFDKIGKEADAVWKTALRDSFQTHLEYHRRAVLEMILNNPTSMASYFALYQQISGNYIFSPYVKEDLNYYRAVATSFQNKMPGYERARNLYALVIDAIKQERQAKQEIDWTKFETSQSSGFIDLELKDKNGYPQKLSALVGQPIILDFSAYAVETNVDYTFELRDIYNRYSSQGLQIYQVSVDQNKLFWQRNVSNIPWIAVHDENGRAAQSYNIEQIPTLFLIDKDGNIIGRYSSIETLKTDLGKVM
ncbi:MAG: thioredoxin-like domain-containing protein [Paludibacteraceae bacterium]